MNTILNLSLSEAGVGVSTLTSDSLERPAEVKKI
jgi:hypothetical protein